MKKLLAVLVLVAGMACAVNANNIAVTNVSFSDQVAALHYCNVKFDLSWDNSWRTASVPNNWDAAWIFVKYRVSGGVWHHAKLSPTAGDHTPASGSTITPSADSVGVFIYRSANGSGTNTWTNIKVRWYYGKNGVADDASLEVKVFSTEMVYIPQGSFYLGDGNGTTESLYAIHPAASDNNPFQVTTTSAQIKADVSVFDDNYIEGTSSCTLSIDGDGGIVTTGSPTPQTNLNYPTGYNAFYLMKYSASQEQIVDYLNTLTRTQQDQRLAADISGTAPSVPFVLSNLVNVSERNGIRCPADISAPGPITLVCDYSNNTVGNEAGDGQNIGCNYLNWMDMAAYADWAGLRPMTELEFEKAARGTNSPVLNEFAWGTTNLSGLYYATSNAGQASESFSNCGVNTGNGTIASTYYGPVRTGVFAASATNKTRQETGAGYYGNMELSGDMEEFAVILANVAGRSFTGLHGNGELNNSGDADVDYWPGINGNASTTTQNTIYGGTTGVTAYAGGGLKGGDYVNNSSVATISRRNISMSIINRMSTLGIRVCRTAP